MNRIHYPDMTQQERDEQALDFTYGNLALTTNHRPQRAIFERIVMDELGWTKERFDAWAARRQWG